MDSEGKWELSMTMSDRTSRKESPDEHPGEPSGLWEFKLYVAGHTPRSVTAIANLKALCEEHMAGRYKIDIIDLIERPELARTDQVVAIPTLVRKLPGPIRRIIGDLSNTERVLVGLLVGEVARRNQLKLDPKRLNETLRLIASTYEEPQQVIDLYRNDPQLMRGLQNRVMEEQVIDWIAERAEHTDKQLTFQEAIAPQA